MDQVCDRACAALVDAKCTGLSRRECGLRCTTERRKSDSAQCQGTVDLYYQCVIDHVSTCGDGFPACAELEKEVSARCDSTHSFWGQIGLIAILGAGVVLWWRRRAKRIESGYM